MKFIKKFICGDSTIPPSGFIKYWIWSLFGNVQDGYIGDSSWNPSRTDSAEVMIGVGSGAVVVNNIDGYIMSPDINLHEKRRFEHIKKLIKSTNI